MAQDRPCEFGEEALDEIEPRTMLGREGKLEASRRSSVEPGSCFSRYVRGMIIEDQLDRGAGRISGVETLEEFDELPAAVAVSDERMDLPGQPIRNVAGFGAGPKARSLGLPFDGIRPPPSEGLRAVKSPASPPAFFT